MAVSALSLPLPRDVVAEAGALLAALSGLSWAEVGDDELVAVVEGCQTVRSVLRAL